jgi:hypothetical protein
MKRNVISSDAPYGHLLVEYDPQNPDPCFTPECIAYIEARQSGLTRRDIAKLDEIEWFTCHRHTRTMNQVAIPGLRPGGRWDTCYVKRFNTDPYLLMLNEFLAYIPDGFPEEQADRWIIEGYRLTSGNGEQFYPIDYNGNLVAWRKRMLDNAEHFGTLIARFDHGRFVVSDGRETEFADMSVAIANGKDIPDDF